MLDPASWLDRAKELTLGQRRRVSHDCGAGRVLLIEHKAEGFSAWCHRCSDKGWHPHPQPSLAERIARLNAVRATESAAEACSAPPVPTEFNPSLWPLQARVWLYQAGFNNDHIQRCGFYYAEQIDRVVLPVFRDGRVIYWQARGFDPDRPKYLNPPVDRPLAWFGSTGPIVVTEDILSAARCGEVARGCAALGTTLGDREIAELRRASDGDDPLLWLDPDSAGRKGAARMGKALSLAGLRPRIIKSTRDPKLHSRDEIEELLSLA